MMNATGDVNDNDVQCMQRTRNRGEKKIENNQRMFMSQVFGKCDPIS